MKAIGNAWLRSNWFLAAAPVLLAIEWLVVRDIGAQMGEQAEAVVLFDLCVFVPALFLLCYRTSLPIGQLVLRSAALACLGVYLAGLIVPAASQQLLPQLAWVRAAGLVVLALIELRVLIAMVRIVFREDSTVEQVQAASGAPRWVARLMMLEARFWRAVRTLIRRR